MTSPRCHQVRLAYSGEQSTPSIVRLRFGNMRRNEFHRFLAAAWRRSNPCFLLICIYADRIEAFA